MWEAGSGHGFKPSFKPPEINSALCSCVWMGLKVASPPSTSALHTSLSPAHAHAGKGKGKGKKSRKGEEDDDWHPGMETDSDDGNARKK